MLLKLNAYYLISSLILYPLLILLWGSKRQVIGWNIEVFDVVFILFFIADLVYFIRLDFIKKRSFYSELTKNLVLIWISFTVTILLLLILNFVITGQTSVILYKLGRFEQVVIGWLYLLVSMFTHHIAIKKGWK